MIATLLDFIKLKRRNEFVECLEMVYDDISEKEKQNLLFEIVKNHYNHSHYHEFIKLFDKIQSTPINLNFNVNHEATTFLSFVIFRAPYLKLINYFIKKGACVNFVGDTLAFVPEKSMEFAKMHLDGPRYQTCLDFAESELQHLISKNLHFEISGSKPFTIGCIEVNDQRRLLINADEYARLKSQKQYLKRIILTKRAIDYLKSLGAKHYFQKENRS